VLVNDTTAKILGLLRSTPGHLSGEEICREVNLSRTAVWKHITQLRELGYSIDAVTNRGYCLGDTPNVPSAAEVQRLLKTGQFGRHFVFLDETDSTNRVATELAQADTPAGTVVVADRQTAGRGRMQRSWFSPPGLNLYFSLILRPQMPPGHVPQLSLVAGIALCRAIRGLFPELSPRTKWPNDVLIGRRKLAGVLCSMVSEMERVRHLVIGIGVNVNSRVTDMPAELADVATSVRMELGHDVSRPVVLARILDELEQAYKTWEEARLEPFLTDWRELSVLGGKHVVVDALDGQVEGDVVGLARSGELVVQLADGTCRQILGGDVHVRHWQDTR